MKFPTTPEEFDKFREREEKRIKREANRPGGPADTIIIDVTCHSCGGVSNFTLRQCEKSIKNRKCEHCQTKFTEDEMFSRVKAVALTITQLAADAVKASSQLK